MVNQQQLGSTQALSAGAAGQQNPQIDPNNPAMADYISEDFLQVLEVITLITAE